MLKQRRDSIEAFNKAKRQDLKAKYKQCKDESDVGDDDLPTDDLPTDDDLRSIVRI